MSKNKDQLVGIRFTKEEKQLIETFTQERNCTITEFIRESVFSHINNLTHNVGNLDVDEFFSNFKNIEKSAEIVLKSITVLKKRLNVYDFKRLYFNLTKQEKGFEEVKDF
ncbi:hypothetical protein LCGC14_0976360 [marine sediment metagenome]|uniref:Uncharacterized protein n=1 Tax=marine sediment metagenome TaxID=412755 RepID=A0A0F9NWE1_9ZZZZ